MLSDQEMSLEIQTLVQWPELWDKEAQMDLFYKTLLMMKSIEF